MDNSEYAKVSGVFNNAYTDDKWTKTPDNFPDGEKDNTTPSGQGSVYAYTQTLRNELIRLVGEEGIRSIADVPCGLFDDNHYMARWLQEEGIPRGIQYHGGDISDAALETSRKYAVTNNFPGSITFGMMDVSKDALPPVDLLIVKDVMIHMPDEMIAETINNIKRSSARFVILTTFDKENTLDHEYSNVPEGFRRRNINAQICLGEHRYVDLQASPFNLPPPLAIMEESGPPGTEKWLSRNGLWRASDLPHIYMSAVQKHAYINPVTVKMDHLFFDPRCRIIEFLEYKVLMAKDVQKIIDRGGGVREAQIRHHPDREFASGVILPPSGRYDNMDERLLAEELNDKLNAEGIPYQWARLIHARTRMVLDV